MKVDHIRSIAQKKKRSESKNKIAQQGVRLLELKYPNDVLSIIVKNKSAQSATDEATATPRGGRLSIPLNEDGTINWGKVRPSQREAFGAIVANDATALEMIGLAAGDDDSPSSTDDSAEQPENLFDDLSEDSAGQILDWLARGTAISFNFFISKTKKHPFLVNSARKSIPLTISPNILFPAFALSEEDHKNLDPKMLKEMQKHSHKMPNWVKENFNLIMLVNGFLQAQARNGMAAIAAQLQHDQNRIAAARASVPNNPKPNSDATQAPPAEPENESLEPENEPPVEPLTPGRVSNVPEVPLV